MPDVIRSPNERARMGQAYVLRLTEVVGLAEGQSSEGRRMRAGPVVPVKMA